MADMRTIKRELQIKQEAEMRRKRKKMGRRGPSKPTRMGPIDRPNLNRLTIGQIERIKEMEKRNIGYDHVVYLDVAEEEVIRRLMSRGRADDKPEIIKNRIAVYKKETQPVVDYYKDKLITIKAEGGEQPEDIAADIIREIKKRDENF